MKIGYNSIKKGIKKIVFFVLFFLAKSLFAAHFIVTDISDPIGNPIPNTLRWAITQANSSPGIDNIDFNVNGVPVPVEIILNSPLTINEPVIIDGLTQPNNGFNTFEPKITISLLYNILIQDAVIKINASGGGSTLNEITFFRTGASNLALNGYNSLIDLDGSSNNKISNCVFGGLAQVCIQIKKNSDNNQITGNYFTINRGSSYGIYNSLFPPLQSSVDAVFCITDVPTDLPDDNTIGGTALTDFNNFGFRGLVRIICGIHNKVVNFNFSSYVGNLLIINHTANQNKIRPTISPINFNSSGYINNVDGISEPNDLVELYYRNLSSNQQTYILIGRTTASSSGSWSLSNLNINSTQSSFIAYATSPSGNTSNADVSVALMDPNCPICSVIDFEVPSLICKGSQITFIDKSINCKSNPNVAFNYPVGITNPFYWNFENGPNEVDGIHTFTNSGVFPVQLTYLNYPYGNDNPYSSCNKNSVLKYVTVVDDCTHDQCKECIGSFAPEPGVYILSAWVRQTNAVPTTTSFDQASILIDFLVSSGSPPPTVNCTSSGNIIDGWQKIEKEITVPSNASHIKISLNALPYSDCLFDDIRFQPKKSSMKSYVYDPLTLRLSAELDERNYATFYEYDEDGKLIRVKKETERGIMTIQENKNNTVKVKHD